MSPGVIRDALAAMSDREVVLFWFAIPAEIRACVRGGLHARLDEIAHAEAELDVLFPGGGS